VKRAFLLLLTAFIACAAIFAGFYSAAGGKPTMTATRDLSDAEVRRSMDLVFRAEVRDLLAWTDSLSTECSGEPVYHIVRARLIRELLPVDDENDAVLKPACEPLYSELRTAIAECDARLEAGDKDDKVRLYRGWAWMLMSHVHTYENAFWSAGREAKKGKEDLEWYLKLHPDDPVASSLMGAFLYFADTLPSAYKFVSKLLFLPSGDRDRGLAMMENARAMDNPLGTDNLLILYSVYLGFEGRYEEGLDGFKQLQRDFPLHATFVRPGAIMAPLLPVQTTENSDSLDARTALVSSLGSDRIDVSTCSLILLERAYADRYYNPQRSIERFEKILQDDPKHPDWTVGFSAYELGLLRAAQGDVEAAKRAFDLVIRDDRVKYLRDDAKSARESLKNYPNGTGLGPANVSAIYGADEDARRAVREELAAKQSPTIADQFYLGEAWLRSGELDKALAAFTGVINPSCAVWDQQYQMVACTRAGEILGAQGDFTSASKHYERAVTFWHKEYLYDWVLGARERYFERLSEGKETTKPSLLTASMQ
jgi:tetratricopeptide (TPR) repeat protein